MVSFFNDETQNEDKTNRNSSPKSILQCVYIYKSLLCQEYVKIYIFFFDNLEDIQTTLTYLRVDCLRGDFREHC